MSSIDTLVIGAGLAGLSAARTLRRSGQRVLVLESARRLGGRVCTISTGGCLSDAGAQFLSTGYRHILGMLPDLGLRWTPLRATRTAILLDGRWRPVRPHSALDVLSQGVLGPAGCTALTWLVFKHRRALASLDLSDYSAWAALDTRSALEAWRDGCARQMLDCMVEPMLEGLYFQQPHTTSQALALLMLAFGSRRHTLGTLAGGLGRLPEAMARHLDVRLETPVDSVDVEADQVVAHTPDGPFTARRLILASPGHAGVLLRPTTGQPLPTPPRPDYSSTVLLSLVLDARWKLPAPLNDVYGGVVPHRHRRGIAAITIENHKSADRARNATLVHVMSDDETARQASRDDEPLLHRLYEALDDLLPGARGAVRDVSLTRWPHAEPRSPVGRAREAALYRQSLGRSARVVHCGDYLGAPFTEGAVESGLWAATHMLRTSDA